jgi:bifunctional UDP-N-acetylglucosamine pyrophosphorylase / glucosamine-1-phosphate N-acetyltransferase
MITSDCIAIILAAGKGTRLNSDLPKVLHPIHHTPMIHRVIHSVNKAGIQELCIVVGYKKDVVINACTPYTKHFVTQEPQNGTGHAVQCALPILSQSTQTHTIVLAGDCPLIQPQTLLDLMATHTKHNAAATILSASLPDAKSYGRILRNTNNNVIGIKEAKDCTPDQLTIQEFNSGIYCFKTKALIEAIQQISNNNAQNEYYLTDTIHYLHNNQQPIAAHCINDANQIAGANTIEELAELNKLAEAYN